MLINNAYHCQEKYYSAGARPAHVSLILIVPLVIASLIGVSIPSKAMLNTILPAMLATLILFFGFLLSGIVFSGEIQGTRERLMASPSPVWISWRLSAGFLAFAMLQTLILFFYTVYVCKWTFRENYGRLLFFNFNRYLAVCLGFLSLLLPQRIPDDPVYTLDNCTPDLYLRPAFSDQSDPDWLQLDRQILPLTYASTV